MGNEGNKKASARLALVVKRGGLFQASRFAQQAALSVFPWEMFMTKVTVSRGLFVIGCSRSSI